MKEQKDFFLNLWNFFNESQFHNIIFHVYVLSIRVFYF